MNTPENSEKMGKKKVVATYVVILVILLFLTLLGQKYRLNILLYDVSISARLF